MKKIKTIRVVRLYQSPDRGAYERPAATCLDDASDQNGLDLWQSPEEYEKPVVTYPDEASDEDADTEAVEGYPLQLPPRRKGRRYALLLKEVDEINSWARLASLLYFLAFTLLLTVNGFAMAWLATSNRASIFFMFIVLDLIGALATVLVAKYLLEGDRRIQEVIGMLTEHDEAEGPWSMPQSPIPRQAINILFGFAGFALIILLLFWTTWFVIASSQ